MKKIYVTCCALVVLLSGCAQQSALVNAIEDNYEMDKGQVRSSFVYNTKFENLDVGGNIKGNVLLTLGKDFDKLEVKSTFNEVTKNKTYYIDSDDNALELVDKKVVTSLVTPIFEKNPNLSELTDVQVEPTVATVNALGTEYKADKYVVTFDDKLNTDIAKVFFETIIDLGFVDASQLQSEEINGKFNLVFYIDQESGKLVREEFTYNNEDVSEFGKSNVKITNEFSFDEIEFEVPSEFLEVE